MALNVSVLSCCLVPHRNSIVCTICHDEVRMSFTNCLAGSQVVKKDRAMGPTAQYKHGLATVLAKHYLRV